MLEHHILRFPHVVNWDEMQVGEQAQTYAVPPAFERCGDDGNSKDLELIVTGKESNALKERGAYLNQPIINSRHSVKAKSSLFQHLRKTLSPTARGHIC